MDVRTWRLCFSVLWSEHWSQIKPSQRNAEIRFPIYSNTIYTINNTFFFDDILRLIITFSLESATPTFCKNHLSNILLHSGCVLLNVVLLHDEVENVLHYYIMWCYYILHQLLFPVAARRWRHFVETRSKSSELFYYVEVENMCLLWFKGRN